jgi:hypothetical protein
MKTLLFLIIFNFILSSPFTLNAEDVDPGVKAPIKAAKEYIAEKYGCEIDSLTAGDVLIGRRSSHIDINRDYETERVILRYNETEQRWEAESSEPLNKY